MLQKYLGAKLCCCSALGCVRGAGGNAASLQHKHSSVQYLFFFTSKFINSAMCYQVILESHAPLTSCPHSRGLKSSTRIRACKKVNQCNAMVRAQNHWQPAVNFSEITCVFIVPVLKVRLVLIPAVIWCHLCKVPVLPARTFPFS